MTERRIDVYIVHSTSSEDVHRKAIEELRQLSYRSLRSLVLHRLSKDINIKRGLLSRNYVNIRYKSEEGDMLKFKYVFKPNDGTTGFGGIYGFFCNAPSGMITKTSKRKKEKVNFINLPAHLDEIFEFLKNDNSIAMEGIFLKSSPRKTQDDLIWRLLDRNNIEFEKEGFTAYDCANILKLYLHQLAEPIFPSDYYAAYEKLSDLIENFEQHEMERLNSQAFSRMNGRITTPNSELRKMEQQIQTGIQLIVQLLPPRKRQFFIKLIDILEAVYIKRDFNLVTASSLGRAFGPSLMCPRGLPRPVRYSITKSTTFIMSRMIKMGKEVLEPPLKLQTDVWNFTRPMRINIKRDQKIRNAYLNYE